MKYLHSWLQEYIKEPLPAPAELARVINASAFEFEGMEQTDEDIVLDFDIKPNRTHDAQSHLGMAREIATLFDLTFVKSTVSYSCDTGLKTTDHLAAVVEDSIFAPRVMKRIITDITVGPSPQWLKKKLESLGQRSINNIVDITNYVMLETGQPSHAFDYDKLAGSGQKKVYLRKAAPGERIATLDGKELNLKDSIFVWADEDKALDIAGIKGGSVSGIDENTRTIMVSVCNFNPALIRKTSRSIQLVTDASKRYEQGLSPELTQEALDRVCTLIQECAGGKVAEDVIDIYPRKRNPYRIGVSLGEVNKLLGTELTEKDMESILMRMKVSYEICDPLKRITTTAQSLIGKKYKYGASVSYDAPNEFDCSSLLVYIYAQAGVSLPRMTVDQFVYGYSIEEKDLQTGDIIFSRNDKGTMEPEFTRISDGEKTTNEGIKFESKEFLPGTPVPEGISHNGLYMGEGKVIHASAKWHRGEVVIEELKESEAFKNIIGYRRMLPDTQERYVVTVPSDRLDLIAMGFLTNGNKEDLIEEIGRVYGYDNIAPVPLTKHAEPEINKTYYYCNKVRDILVGLGFSEVYTYSLAAGGDVMLANPLASDKAYLRDSLAGGIQKALKEGTYYKDLLGKETITIFEIGTVFNSQKEYISCAFGTADKAKKAEEAVMSAKKTLEHALGIELPGAYTDGIFEFDFTELLERLPQPDSYEDLLVVDTKEKIFQPISQYPFVLRDIALWVPSQIEAFSIENLIQDTAGSLLAKITLFDEFKKEERTSYAFHLVFQSFEKTLSDEEVTAIMKTIETALKERGFEVR